jgi:hypothetical protein
MISINLLVTLCGQALWCLDTKQELITSEKVLFDVKNIGMLSISSTMSFLYTAKTRN